MDIENLTIAQAREIAEMFGNFKKNNNGKNENDGLNEQIGEYVIIRTYSAGVWFGRLEKKSGNEVILSEARRMYQWWCAKSISLSGVAKYGILADKSQICPALPKVWLEAIEILTLSDIAIKSLKGAPDVEAK